MDPMVLGVVRLGLAAWLVGTAAVRGVPRVLPGKSRRPSEIFLRAWLLGTFAAVTSVAVAGAFGVLSSWVLLAAAAGVALAAWGFGRRPHMPQIRWRSRGWPIGCAALTAGLLGFDLVRSLPVPPTELDAHAYHLYIPARWLQEGRLFHVPTPFADVSIASFAPKQGSLFFAWQMALSDRDTTCNVSLVGALLFLMFAGYRIARLLGLQRTAALLAALTLACLQPLRRWATSCYVEVFMTCFWWGAVYWQMLYLRRREWGTLLACALATGLAAGTKVIGLPLVVPHLAVLGFVLVRERRFRELLTFPVVALAGGGWWFLVNAWQYGNPLFPLQLRVGGWVLPGAYDASGMAHSPQRLTSFWDWLAQMVEAWGTSTWLFTAFGLLMLAVAAITARKHGRKPTGWAYLAALAFYWVWFDFARFPSNSQMRLFVPILAPAALGWGLALDIVARSRPRAAPLVWGVAAIAVVVGSPAPSHGRLVLDPLSWTMMGLLAASAATVAGHLVRPRRHLLTAAWVLACLALVPASFAADRDRADALDRAAFFDWRDGYHRFNEIASPPQRIAYSGMHVPYALMGIGWRNVVVYCNVQGDDDDGLFEHSRREGRLAGDFLEALFRGHEDPAVWLEHLERANVDLLAVFALNPIAARYMTTDDDQFPAERRWARERPELFEPVLIGERAEIYRRIRGLSPTPDRAAQSPGERAAARAGAAPPPPDPSPEPGGS